jgi:uncharacterized OB-fold protein
MSSTGTPVGVLARDDETAPFLDAAAAGTLVVQQCGRCAQRQFPSPTTPGTGRCHSCASDALSWVPVAGTGRLVTWTLQQGRPAPDGTPAAVTVLGVVELDEGPWVHTQLRVHEPVALEPDMRLAVQFERPEGGEPLPVFGPA